MDALTALLDAPRAHGAFLLRVTMTPPWAVRVRDEAPLSVVAMTDGSACFVPGDGEAVRLFPGDLLLIARPDPYLFADTADRQPQAVIHPDNRCETLAGANLELPVRRGVRTWGNAAKGRDIMLVGTYPSVTEAGSRLLRALPPALVMRAADHRSGLIDVLAEEILGEGIGQASLLDRLLDGLTVAAIRHWADSAAADAPGWLRTGVDPIVDTALDLMHDHTAHPWTIASLARRVGMSRAGFCRRFAATVGQPPMTYLTSWRLAVAADRLRHDDVPVYRVAADIGYPNPFTFSTAFKRHFGVSPFTYRRQRTATAEWDPADPATAGRSPAPAENSVTSSMNSD